MANGPYKDLEVTAEMLAQIEKVTGSAVTAGDIMVFEATVANTRPLNKPGSIFNRGVITRATLSEMAEAVNSGSQNVPLHLMHQVYSDLPVGRVFDARAVEAVDGNTELVARLYLANSEAGVIEKINLGVVNEVSVGLSSKRLLCSECGFDFLGESSDSYAVYEQTCGNGHLVGQDGVHVIVSGMDNWSELSLVSRGAVRGTKIHGRATHSAEVSQRLAASGIPLGALVLSASPQDHKKEPVIVADPITPVAPDLSIALSTIATQLSALTTLLTPPPEPVVDQAALDLAAAQAEVVALTAQLAEATKITTGVLSSVPVGGVATGAVTDATLSLRASSTGSAFQDPSRVRK